jgi:hypothetical protein
VIFAADGPANIREKTLETVMSSNFRGPTFVVRNWCSTELEHHNLRQKAMQVRMR